MEFLLQPWSLPSSHIPLTLFYSSALASQICACLSVMLSWMIVHSPDSSLTFRDCTSFRLVQWKEQMWADRWTNPHWIKEGPLLLVHSWRTDWEWLEIMNVWTKYFDSPVFWGPVWRKIQPSPCSREEWFLFEIEINSILFPSDDVRVTHLIDSLYTFLKFFSTTDLSIESITRTLSNTLAVVRCYRVINEKIVSANPNRWRWA